MRRRWLQAAALLVVGAGAVTCSAVGHSSEAARQVSFSALGTSVVLAVLAFAFASLRRVSLSEGLGLAPSRVSRRTLCALVAGTLCLSQMLDSGIELTGAREGSVLEDLDAALTGARGASFLLFLIAIGIVPGIAEELFFRGFLQRALLARIRPAAAVSATALLFGLAHIDPVHAAAAAVLGLYLGVVSHLSGSTRAAIACHAANNLISVGTTAWGVQWPPALLLATVLVGGAGAAIALRTSLREASQRRAAGGAHAAGSTGPAPPVPEPGTAAAGPFRLQQEVGSAEPRNGRKPPRIDQEDPR